MDWHKDEEDSCLVTDSLGVIIVRFCIILFDVEGIALLFEAFCFPVFKCGGGGGGGRKKRLNLKRQDESRVYCPGLLLYLTFNITCRVQNCE